MKTRILLSVFSLVICNTLFAAPNLAELQALYPVTDKQSWSYSVEIKDDIGLRIERRQDGIWSLLSYEGQAPDANDLTRYQEYLEDEEAQEERTTPDYFIGSMLSVLSEITVLEESESEVIYKVNSADLNDDPDDDMHQYLQARLYLDPVTNSITRLTLESIEPFSPQAMVKVHSMKVEADISDGSNSIPKGFLREQRTTMKGKVMGLKNIEQQEFYRYSDFSLSNVEMIPVEADGGIGDGAGPMPIGD